jgi:hypothetical protein
MILMAKYLFLTSRTIHFYSFPAILWRIHLRQDFEDNQFFGLKSVYNKLLRMFPQHSQCLVWGRFPHMWKYLVYMRNSYCCGMAYALQQKIYIFLFWELRGLSPNFHIHVSVSDLYIPTFGPPIFLQQNRQTDQRIYKSPTDTWMWKLGLWPRNSSPGNICFEFSVFSLQCKEPSAEVYSVKWTTATKTLN